MNHPVLSSLLSTIHDTARGRVYLVQARESRYYPSTFDVVCSFDIRLRNLDEEVLCFSPLSDLSDLSEAPTRVRVVLGTACFQGEVQRCRGAEFSLFIPKFEFDRMPEKDLGGVFRLFGCSELQNKNVRLKLPIRGRDTLNITTNIYSILPIDSKVSSCLVGSTGLRPSRDPTRCNGEPGLFGASLDRDQRGFGRQRRYACTITAGAASCFVWLSYQKSEIASQLPIVALLPIQDFQP